MRAGKPGLPAGDVTDIFGIDAARVTARIDGGHVDLPRLIGIMVVRSGERIKTPRRRQDQAGAAPGLASCRRCPERAFGTRPSQLAVCLRNNALNDYRLKQSMSLRLCPHYGLLLETKIRK